MARFKITETAPATITWDHWVEAKNEEEAYQKVLDGDTLESVSFSDINGDTEIENIIKLRD